MLSPEPRPRGPPGPPDRVPYPERKGRGHPGQLCQAGARSPMGSSSDVAPDRSTCAHAPRFTQKRAFLSSQNPFSREPRAPEGQGDTACPGWMGRGWEVSCQGQGKEKVGSTLDTADVHPAWAPHAHPLPLPCHRHCQGLSHQAGLV